MKATQRIEQYAKIINDLGIPVIIRESMYCSRCRQRLGTIRNDKATCYPCLNSNCGNFSNVDLIKSTWEKMEAVQNA